MSNSLSRSATNKHLIITDTDGDSARIIRLDGEGIELSPHPGAVIILGEDLYVLREFLLDLPEWAFVKPAPPWQAGDLVVDSLGSSSAIYYVRGDSAWTAHGRHADRRWVAGDTVIEEILSDKTRDIHVLLRAGKRPD